MYASGSTTLGGYFPGVDTFLGLQIAAQEIAGPRQAGLRQADRAGPLDLASGSSGSRSKQI